MKKQESKKAALSPAKSKTAAKLRARQLSAPDVSADNLLTDIRELIAGAKTRVAQAVNTGQLLLNWHIGNRIRTDILGEKRADYGKQIVQTPSAQIDPRIRERLLARQHFQHDSLRGSFSKPGDCPDTVQTIGLVVCCAANLQSDSSRHSTEAVKYWRM